MKKALPVEWADRARDAFHASGLTLQQVGVATGYPVEDAYQGTWRFLYRTPEPAMPDLRSFARAVGISLKALLG